MLKPGPTLLSALLLALNVGAAAATGPSDGSANTTVPLVLAVPGAEFEGLARFDNSFAGSARGETLHQYRQRTRLDLARRWLGDQRLAIKKVAQRLNFSTEFHFSRFFRRGTGLSPTRFRERSRA